MNNLHWPYPGPRLLWTAEGGTSGKNTSTDQRQIQLTTGTTGASSPNATATEGGSVVYGDAVQAGGDVMLTDQNAVDRAFGFAEGVASEVGKIFANESATQKATVDANSEFLAGVTGLIQSNSAGGATETQSKTLLYVVGGVLALVAVIFFFRR